MTTQTTSHETIDDLRNFDLFAEASKIHSEPAEHVSPATRELCRTVLFAADILKRAIIATYDAEQERREYNP